MASATVVGPGFGNGASHFDEEGAPVATDRPTDREDPHAFPRA
jgi:hypothetical protein